MRTPELPIETPPLPHPRFHDRIHRTDVGFTPASHAAAARYRDASKADDVNAARGLWPASRPTAAQIWHAAFRATLRSHTKVVLLSLIVTGDEAGVSMLHRTRMVAFCGVSTVEFYEALHALVLADVIVVHSDGVEISRPLRQIGAAHEHVVLVRRPELWRVHGLGNAAGAVSFDRAAMRAMAGMRPEPAAGGNA